MEHPRIRALMKMSGMDQQPDVGIRIGQRGGYAINVKVQNEIYTYVAMTIDEAVEIVRDILGKVNHEKNELGGVKG